MNVEIGVPDFAKVMREAESSVARAATVAMRATTGDALRELRGQVTSAGLGQRLANTWRGNVYPKSRNGMNPAGYIYSRAPDIIDSFVRGATIRPVGGAKFLWIPTGNVPRANARMGRISRQSNGRMGSRGLKGGALTPEECEDRFNADFIIRQGKRGHLLAFMQLIRSRNGRGVRANTAGRQRQGRTANLTLMYTLVPSARMPKLLDLEGPAARWSANYIDAFTRGLEKNW
ncbi:DUF6441 family protein [Sphingomonas sp. ACRSK]|uniref:DUF6441 family protein n=1 Tax=Sphingomonas sp. ACRSK TaxID=2918213 RepID=UPI001EF4D661|nr:DUF6441 family protein [Sphingomonas sp. ACRSK]MCG7350031.1 DUF6441 family protein [Sphingomonas sp. ACRSK]